MSDRRESRRLGDMARGAMDWLRGLRHSTESASQQEHMAAIDSTELLQRAARCYAAAGWDDDACRLFVQLGDDKLAAPYFERQGQWQAAAECYVRLGDWHNGGRCFLQANAPTQAATCYEKADRLMDAAWLWAEAHQFQRAEATLQGYTPASEADGLAVELIRARCEAGLGRRSAAARRLSRVMSQLQTQPPDFRGRQLYDWAMIVAQTLQRRDLTVMLHAMAYAADYVQAQERWEGWAKTEFGDAASVPIDERAGDFLDTDTGGDG